MSISRVLCAVMVVGLWAPARLAAQMLPDRGGQAPLQLTLVTEADRVRVTAPGAALVWRLQVVNAQGDAVFDSGLVAGTELDWPLIDVQGHAVESGLYRYTLTIGDGASPARVQRGELQIERQRSLYRISSLMNESIGGITVTTTEGAAPSATGFDQTSPFALPRSLGSAAFGAPQPYISGSGTSGRLTRWTDGPTGLIGDSQVSEANGSVVVGNGSFPGNLHIFGASNNDLFAGMGPDLVSGPAFNFGYAGASFGRGAGFLNVRPDASATYPNPSLRFMTANVERMIIANSGNVGIGTSAPGAKLTVVSGAGTAIYANTNGLEISDLGIYSNSSNGTAVLGNSTSGFGVHGSSNYVGVYGKSYGNNAAVWGVNITGAGQGVSGYSENGIGVVGESPNGTAGKFLGKVSLMGSVGIGTETPARTLDVAGLFRVKNGAFGIEMNGTGGFFPVLDAVQPLGDGTHRWQAVFATLGTIQTSDARLKQRVTNLEDGLAAVTRLRPVTFEWKDTGDGRRHLGLLAQEVEPVLPGVVHRDANPDVPLGLNYSELIPVVIKAIQEQQATITRLANENAALAARLAALEHVIQQIKKQH